MGGARHRQKGNRVEREIVNLHRQIGIYGMGAFAVNGSRRQTPRFFRAVFSRERASD
jgi:hypothetical protein